jgi:hypothetical protein
MICCQYGNYAKSTTGFLSNRAGVRQIGAKKRSNLVRAGWRHDERPDYYQKISEYAVAGDGRAI